MELINTAIGNMQRMRQYLPIRMFANWLQHLKKSQEKDFSAKAFRIALSSAGESLILSKSVFAKSGEEVNGKSWNNLISDTIAKKGMLSPSVLRS